MLSACDTHAPPAKGRRSHRFLLLLPSPYGARRCGDFSLALFDSDCATSPSGALRPLPNRVALARARPRQPPVHRKLPDRDSISIISIEPSSTGTVIGEGMSTRCLSSGPDFCAVFLSDGARSASRPCRTVPQTSVLASRPVIINNRPPIPSTQ